MSRSIILKGSGLDLVWPNIVLLIVYTAIVYLIAVARLRKKVA